MVIFNSYLSLPEGIMDFCVILPYFTKNLKHWLAKKHDETSIVDQWGMVSPK